MPVPQTFHTPEFQTTAILPEAARQLERYAPLLLRYCQKLTGSQWDAEDLVQDTLLKAWPTWTHPHDNPTAFLFRIAKNAWIDKCRKRKLAQECPLEAELAEPAVDRIAIEEAMTQLLQHLSPMQRVVFLLREVFAFTAGEVAEKIGTTEGAVKSALHRARKTLEAVRTTPQEEKQANEAERNMLKGILNSYLEAFWNSDVEALVLLAQQDVIHPVHALSTLWSTEQQRDKQQAKARLSRSPLASISYWAA